MQTFNSWKKQVDIPGNPTKSGHPHWSPEHRYRQVTREEREWHHSMDICRVCKEHNIDVPEPILHDNDEDPVLDPWDFRPWAALQTPGRVHRKAARFGANVLSELTWNCIKERYVTFRQAIAVLCLILDGATAENFAEVGWKPKDEQYHGVALPSTQ